MNKPAELTRQLKLIKIGNSAGVLLPRDVLERLNLAVGDSLSCYQTPDGLTLSTHDPEFEAQMAEARTIMSQYRNALRELAK